MPEKRLSSASGATSAGGKKQSGPNAKAETPAALAEGDRPGVVVASPSSHGNAAGTRAWVGTRNSSDR